MAIRFKDIRSAINTINPSLTITRPPNLAVGDFMVMLLNTSGGATSAWGLLTGWTTWANLSPNAEGITCHISWKFANAADVAAVDFRPSCTGTGGGAGSIAVYTGVWKTDPTGASFTASVTDGSIELLAVTMRGGSTRLLIGMSSAHTPSDSAGLLNIPGYAGLGLNLRDAANAGATECHTILFDQLNIVGGSQPAVTIESVETGNTEQHGFYLELNAAPIAQGIL